jgi:D-beta-D-heptose 7-phosphate kinase/D-beta-D-heptose 1-phosphate adenosyltransferase
MRIWTNGCFDVLHIGHIEMFRYAKSKGSYLVVGIDSDERVRSLKGEGRPINNQEDRANFLRAIKYIDEVFIFDNEDHMVSLVESNGIDLIVVGEEYRDRKVTGSNVCQVEYFPRIGEYSTTSIINSK